MLGLLRQAEIMLKALSRRSAIVVHLLLFSSLLTGAEVHHQRPLLRAGIKASEAIALHAQGSLASFVVGDHLVSWLQDRAEQLVSTAINNTVTAEDVVFVIMASEAKRERVVTQRSSWMRWAVHTFAFADVDDVELGLMTTPETANKTGFGEAQVRQLYGMRWLYHERRDLMDKKWFFLVDDDTWVNVPSLLEFVSSFPPGLPLSFSHIYLRHNRAVYNGGAGMLFSNEAFTRIAAALFTSSCSLNDIPPAPMNNDNILSACAYSSGVLKVTSSKFSSYGGTEFIDPLDDTGWLDQITMHKVTNKTLAETMWCWSERLHGHSVQNPCHTIAEAEQWD